MDVHAPARHTCRCLAALAAAALGACGPRPIARTPVALLADLPRSAATEPAVELDPRPAANAALSIAAHMSRSAAEAAYIRTLADALSATLMRENALLLQQDDPELQARAARIVSFNAAIASFLADAMTDESTDPAARNAWIRWGLAPEHMEQVAAVYAADVTVRATAAAALARTPGPEADRLLATLINDPDREVALRAIDAAWDRAPADRVIDALLQKGVLLGLQQMGVSTDQFSSRGAVTPQYTRTIIIRGRAFPIANDQIDLQNRMADAPIAVDLLLAYNSPKVRAKVDALFTSLATADRSALARALSPNYGEPALQFRRLIEAYNPPHALPAIIAGVAAAGSTNDGYYTSNNGKNYRVSARIDLFGIALDMLQESHADYGLVRLNNWGNRWVFDGDNGDEEKAVKKLLAFWKEHYKQFGADAPDLPKSTGTSTTPIYRSMDKVIID
jgi:hypothetical protein